jgi:hypothetical protein
MKSMEKAKAVYLSSHATILKKGAVKSQSKQVTPIGVIIRRRGDHSCCTATSVTVGEALVVSDSWGLDPRLDR